MKENAVKTKSGKNNGEKTVALHFTPGYVLEYVKNLSAHSGKDKRNGPAERAMMEDIVTLIQIAVSVMQPQQTDSANDK